MTRITLNPEQLSLKGSYDLEVRNVGSMIPRGHQVPGPYTTSPRAENTYSKPLATPTLPAQSTAPTSCSRSYYYGV